LGVAVEFHGNGCGHFYNSALGQLVIEGSLYKIPCCG
jgi:hypothetical protein